jgi:hypothetical protein
VSCWGFKDLGSLATYLAKPFLEGRYIPIFASLPKDDANTEMMVLVAGIRCLGWASQLIIEEFPQGFSSPPDVHG